MAIIRFATNVPRNLHMRFLEGKPVESQFGGIQHMFTSEEGTFYVSDKVGGILANQFRSLGVQPGDPVEITKAENGHGPERRTQWQVAVSGEPAAAAPSVEPPSELEKQLAASIQMVEVRKAQAAAQNVASAVAAVELPRWAQTLAMQTRHLVDVYAGLVAYSSEKHGNLVKPEDVRALMTTAFINLSKGGSNSNAA